jgi:hypothetical protein
VTHDVSWRFISELDLPEQPDTTISASVVIAAQPCLGVLRRVIGRGPRRGEGPFQLVQPSLGSHRSSAPVDACFCCLEQLLEVRETGLEVAGLNELHRRNPDLDEGADLGDLGLRA